MIGAACILQAIVKNGRSHVGHGSTQFTSCTHQPGGGPTYRPTISIRSHHIQGSPCCTVGVGSDSDGNGDSDGDVDDESDGSGGGISDVKVVQW